jgi:hypothetical protein
MLKTALSGSWIVIKRDMRNKADGGNAGNGRLPMYSNLATSRQIPVDMSVIMISSRA